MLNKGTDNGMEVSRLRSSMGSHMNIPDRWVVIEVTSDKTKLYRVFACWYGGWAGSDSWQINSGIVGVDDQSNYFDFEGHSGSMYRCYKDNHGLHLYGSSVLNNLIEKSKEKDIIITVLPEDTNWKELIDGTNVAGRDNKTEERE